MELFVMTTTFNDEYVDMLNKICEKNNWDPSTAMTNIITDMWENNKEDLANIKPSKELFVRSYIEGEVGKGIKELAQQLKCTSADLFKQITYLGLDKWAK